MLLDLLPSILLISSLISSYVNFEISWEEFRSFRGRFGLFDVALYCRASSRNVQIASHEVSKCTLFPQIIGKITSWNFHIYNDRP
jgi:hypothetical protein